jgi:hypothetical protein
MPSIVKELYLITGFSICREITKIVKIVEAEGIEMQGKFSSAQTLLSLMLYLVKIKVLA